MGQKEIMELLKKCKTPMTAAEVHKHMEENRHCVDRSLRKLEDTGLVKVKFTDMPNRVKTKIYIAK